MYLKNTTHTTNELSFFALFQQAEPLMQSKELRFTQKPLTLLLARPNSRLSPVLNRLLKIADDKD